MQVQNMNKFFKLADHKVHFIAPCGVNKSIFDPLVEKNSLQHGKRIYFIRLFHIHKINFLFHSGEITSLS